MLCSLPHTKALVLAFHVSLFCLHKAMSGLKRGLAPWVDAGFESQRMGWDAHAQHLGASQGQGQAA